MLNNIYYILYTIYFILYTIYYSVYNNQLEDTLKNTSYLPRPAFEPGTSSCGTRKKSFCA